MFDNLTGRKRVIYIVKCFQGLMCVDYQQLPGDSVITGVHAQCYDIHGSLSLDSPFYEFRLLDSPLR